MQLRVVVVVLKTKFVTFGYPPETGVSELECNFRM